MFSIYLEFGNKNLGDGILHSFFTLEKLHRCDEIKISDMADVFCQPTETTA
jgi:hypothetical protein